MHVSVYMYTCMYACMYMHMYIPRGSYTPFLYTYNTYHTYNLYISYIHVHIHIYVYAYVYVYVHMHWCIPDTHEQRLVPKPEIQHSSNPGTQYLR
jgi:hypothetical protein